MRTNSASNFKSSKSFQKRVWKVAKSWDRRTVRAMWADRPGLRAGLHSPDQRRLLSAQSLYYCADCPTRVGGPSASAKWIWAGTVCFWVFVLWTVRGLSPDSTNSQVVDRPALYGGQSACVNPSWSDLWRSKLPGPGQSGQGWRAVWTSLFWQLWQISNGKYNRYLYGGPSGLRARTVRVCAESVLVAHNGWIFEVGYK
jgi:hypothetical protein